MTSPFKYSISLCQKNKFYLYGCYWKLNFFFIPNGPLSYSQSQMMLTCIVLHTDSLEFGHHFRQLKFLAYRNHCRLHRQAFFQHWHYHHTEGRHFLTLFYVHLRLGYIVHEQKENLIMILTASHTSKFES